MARDKPAEYRRFLVVAGVLLIGIMALGSFLRTYQVGDVPPGLHYDEAYYALDALNLLTDDTYPIFFEANNGREPLFIYLLALMFRIAGPSQFTLRLTAALLGALTIPGVFFLAKESFAAFGTRFALVAGVLSALVLGTLYWHVNYSRIGLRAITMPLAEALVLLLFWRAIRTRRRRDFIWAGVLLGASMYTYLAARLLAPLLVLLLLLVAIEERTFLMRHWTDVAVLFGVALLISLPLWLYFLQHPGLFIYRLSQITLDSAVARGEPQQSFWTNLWRTAGMFMSAGDWGWADNLPGRPVFDTVGIVGFAMWLLIALVHFRKARYIQWPICLALMVVPTLLTNYAPTYTRSIGAVIPCAVLTGLGFAQIWLWLDRRLSASWSAVGLVGLALVVAAYCGLTTFRDYFLIWAQQPEVAESFDEEMLRTARAISDLPAQSSVYVSFDESRSYHASLDFFMWQGVSSSPDNPAQPHLYWHNRNCLVIPSETGSGLAYLLPPVGETFLATLQATFPTGETSIPTYSIEGEPLFALYCVGGEGASVGHSPHPSVETTYTLGDAIRLIGADVTPAGVAAGDTFHVTLYWRPEERVDRGYTIFIQLIGQQHNPAGTPVWGQQDEPPCQDTFPTTAWEPGTTVLTRHVVPIAPDAPPGDYWLNVGMYYLPTGKRLSVRGAGGEPIPDNSATLIQLDIAS